MNKSKKIAIICVIITAVALVACSVFAYLYFSQKTEKVHDKESGTISETDNNKTVIDATDEEMIANPTVNEEISGGECIISSDFTKESAEVLAAQIKGGMLPFSLELFEKRTFSEKQ